MRILWQKIMPKRLPRIFLLEVLLLLVVLGIAGAALTRLTTAKPILSEYFFKPKIIIDAGHGGIDGGAVGVNGAIEKDINLAIALNLRDMLLLSGFDVVMTRETDVSIHDEGVKGIARQKSSDLNNRFTIIENNPEALFISIHQNTYTQGRYSGAQMFYGGSNPQSKVLAEIFQQNFRSKLQPDNNRKIKQVGRSVYLTYYAPVPAVLIECGFLSNFQEAEMLTDPQYQQAVAFVIFGSLLEYVSVS